jgi:hypothetical protein
MTTGPAFAVHWENVMRRSFYAFACLAVVAACAVRDFVALAVDRAFRAVFEVLAEAPRFAIAAFGQPATGPRFAYDGPPVHELRHEAGTSRRSAARNV